MDFNEDDDTLLSSQIVEEEDLLFDESHHDQDSKVETARHSNNVEKAPQQLETDETLRVRLAGPSTNKVSHSIGLVYSFDFICTILTQEANRLACRWSTKKKSMKLYMKYQK